MADQENLFELAQNSRLPRTDSTMTLNLGNLLDDPPCSVDELLRHRRWLATIPDVAENDQQVQDIFDSANLTKKVFRPLLEICRTLHSLMECELPRILRRLEVPMSRLPVLSELPEPTRDVLARQLTDLQTLENAFKKANNDLSDLAISGSVPDQAVREYRTYLETSNGTKIIRYWISSCAEVIDRADEHITTMRPRQPEPASSANPFSPSNTPPSPFPSSPAYLDLSKVKINTFSGRFEEFPQFFGLVKNALDQNHHYSEITKISFVISLLAGEPLHMIQAVPVAEGSLSIILNALEGRYGDKRGHSQRLLKELKDKRASVPRTHSDLKNWYYRLKIMRETLLPPPNPNTDRDTLATHEELFISHMLESLPHDIHKATTEHFEHASLYPTVDEILTYLDGVIRSRERFALCRDGISLDVQPQTPNTFASARNNRDICAFCSGTHYSRTCQSFPDITQRQEVIRQKGLCRRCLKTGHYTSQCRSSACPQCRGDHHSSICFQAYPRPPPTNSSAQHRPSNSGSTFPNNIQPEAPNTRFPTTTQPAKTPALPPLHIKGLALFGNDTSMSPNVRISPSTVPVRAFIDTGSEGSFVDLAFCREFQIPVDPPAPRIIMPVGGKEFMVETYPTCISLIPKSGELVRFKVHAVSNLHEFFTGAMPPSDQVPIRLVLGQDTLTELDIQKTPHSTTDGKRIMSSRFGNFVVSPGFLESSHPQQLAIRRAKVAELGRLEQISDLTDREEVERGFAIDCFLGKDECLVESDLQAMKQVARSMQFRDNRYWVRLPWLESGPLPISFPRARSRIRSLAARLSPLEFRKYKDNLMELIQLGFLEFVKDWEVPDHPRCYYLAHHAVFKLSDTGESKMRIVYDGAAHSSGEPSLNDLLLRGPVFLPSLQGILIRFLFCNIVILADIEKAFLQVGVCEEERDSLRILFGNSPQDILKNRLWHLRFRRLPFGLKCSPAILAIVIDSHLRTSSHPLASEIGRNLYVDNSLLDATTDSEACAKALEAHRLFLRAGMNLRDFASNSACLRSSLDSSLLNPAKIVKVLGLYWDQIHDQTFIKSPIWDKLIPSKLRFSSLQARLFDPLGIVRPISVKAHLLLSRCWTKGSSSESPPLPSSESTISNFLASFDGRSIPVSRFGSTLSQDFHIHIFTDASFDAAGAVAYVQDVLSNHAHVIVSKAKLTPSSLRPRPHERLTDSPEQTLTVNTLEILALDLGAKLASFLQTELPRPAVSYNLWTDSTCALAWLGGQEPPRNRIFVKNRVDSIKSVKKLVFRHISGKTNPADILSRGADLEALMINTLWWRGPDLLKNPDTWPQPVLSEPLADLIAIKGNRFSEAAIPLSEPDQLALMSSNKSFLATIKALRKKLQCSFNQAQDWLFRIDQHLEKPSDRDIEKYALARDRGIWFVVGRLENSELPEPEKHPIFLSKTSWLLPKLLVDLHSRVHPNLSTSLSSLRPFVFFPGGQAHLKRALIRVCEPCQRAFARPCVQPPIPALPQPRTTRNKPFSFVGMDCCGPFAIIHHGKLQKSYLLVVTCFTTRYTHLEIAERGDTRSLVLAFRRFVSLFGLPLEVLSDNGRNFILGSKVLSRVSRSVSSLGPIVWNFTTPYSPWQGGIYERMIRILKEALRKSMPSRPLTAELFRTLVAEIAALLNQRPILAGLSRCSTPQVLRPVDLVLPEKRDSFPVLCDNEAIRDPNYAPQKADTAEQLLQDWNRSLVRIERFWKSFHNTYLRHLQAVGKPRAGKYILPRVGQVVLLVNPAEKNRNCWRTAVVSKLTFSSDGFCRSVSLEKAGKVVERPISSIAPLELPATDHTLPDVRQGRHGIHLIRRIGLRALSTGKISFNSTSSTSRRPSWRINGLPGKPTATSRQPVSYRRYKIGSCSRFGPIDWTTIHFRGKSGGKYERSRQRFNPQHSRTSKGSKKTPWAKNCCSSQKANFPITSQTATPSRTSASSFKPMEKRNGTNEQSSDFSLPEHESSDSSLPEPSSDSSLPELDDHLRWQQPPSCPRNSDPAAHVPSSNAIDILAGTRCMLGCTQICIKRP